ncbi:MAG: low specificity L-threonine aldolase [Ignavibacteriales bacterium]|nr:low specificity L-threonine aldolase [Ignavibacteriales bacterium]
MTLQFIDLRSDTVTKPSLAMREAMANAEVGDDVFLEDPTVNKLQSSVAELLGKESALYVPSGSMSNQLCIKTHTEMGDEVICEEGAHIFNFETAGPAFLSNVQVKTLKGIRGVFTAEQIKQVIRPKVYYMPTTKLISIENTHNRAGGTIFPLEEIQRIRELALTEGIKMHLDGARLWNASIETGISPKEYASYFDSVSVCFSKGLGAPVGSMLTGDKPFVERARKFRKVFGGGMRQAGILAAAALYAVQNNRERLKEDHAKTRYFANAIAQLSSLSFDTESVQTNIILIETEKTGKTPAEVLAMLKSKNVLLTPGNYNSIRAVFHLDVSMEETQQAATVFQELFK